jgi:hypothetical protein
MNTTRNAAGGTESASAAVEADRRVNHRIPVKLPTTLFGLDGSEVLRFTTDEVGEGGLRFQAPIGYGLAVGQRYQVVFPDEVTERGWGNLVGDGHYATVLRTEMHANTGPDEHVTVGLRFDHPLVL